MWVHVYSGLASRCITLAHAHYLIKTGRGGKNLTIVWPVDQYCGISYKDVFEGNMFEDINVKVIEVLFKNYFKKPGSNSVLSNIQKRNYRGAVFAAVMISLSLIQQWKMKFFILGKKYIDYHKALRFEGDIKKYKEYLEDMWTKLQSLLLKHRRVYVHAYCGIIKGDEALKVDYSVIKFKENYWEKVHKILPEGFNYVGVHIRRTDHEVAIKGSTTDMFIKRINAILESQPGTKFFLATDDIREEENLKTVYGDRIIVQEHKSWGRTNADEMQSGIIDCLCLSCCDYILGSFTSVFSSFASEYGKKQLIICKNSDNI